jgi:EAL domain-containing protein (putative c-di-GMP-specific phosphodiesterase class I)
VFSILIGLIIQPLNKSNFGGFMKKHIVFEILMNQTTQHRTKIAFIIGALLIVDTTLIITTGGIPSAYAHTMYIPIILTALYFGAIKAVIIGVLAGLLVGPLMMFIAYDNLTTEPLANSLYRMFFFVLIGAILGKLFTYLRQQFIRIEKINKFHQTTGLPNYLFFIDHFKSKDMSDEVILTLQINNYEQLNLLLGNEGYYAALVSIHKEIYKFLQKKDVITQVDDRYFWIQIGGDNFEIKVDNLLKNMMSKVITINDVPLYIDYSLGVSLPNSTLDVLTRVKQSNIAAMYAKRKSLKIVVYNQEYEFDQLKFSRLAELPKAIQNEELFVVYQPIIDLQNQTIFGFEALLRWRYQGHVLYPADFLLLAEETHIINQITHWVLKRVLKDYQTFQAIDESLNLAINISQKNLFDQHLIDSMLQAVDNANLPANKLTIEITETALMVDSKVAKEFLLAFRNKGVTTALDDFGMEYSSLSCLNDLPIDKLKIDLHFTKQIVKNERSEILMKTMVDMAHNLDIKVIAEGVETELVIEKLKNMKCDYVQGYYYAKPMTIEDAIQWYKDWENRSDTGN